MKKIIIIILVLVAGVLVLVNTPSSPTTIIAVCPTYHELAKKLDSKKYLVIETNSTADSIALLKAGEVDSIFTGRTLKPDEPQLEAHVIKEGFSFLSKNEMTIRKEELANFVIYTDLDENQLNSVFDINNIVQIDDVYKSLDKGIIITTWENTDYSKANLAHVLEDNGQRLNLSRRPTLYCLSTCDPKLLSDLFNVYE